MRLECITPSQAEGVWESIEKPTRRRSALEASWICDWAWKWIDGIDRRGALAKANTGGETAPTTPSFENSSHEHACVNPDRGRRFARVRSLRKGRGQSRDWSQSLEALNSKTVWLVFSKRLRPISGLPKYRAARPCQSSTWAVVNLFRLPNPSMGFVPSFFAFAFRALHTLCTPPSVPQPDSHTNFTPQPQHRCAAPAGGAGPLRSTAVSRPAPPTAPRTLRAGRRAWTCNGAILFQIRGGACIAHTWAISCSTHHMRSRWCAPSLSSRATTLRVMDKKRMWWCVSDNVIIRIEGVCLPLRTSR